MHEPVLYQEIMSHLLPRPGGRYVDGTLGAGGHARGLLEGSNPDGRLLALDRDPEAIAYAKGILSEFGDRAIYVNASFSRMDIAATENGFETVDGILLDLGLSSRQLDNPERGFSFLHDGPLDMRFNPRSATTAADLINEVSTTELAGILRDYGDVAASRRVAQAIVDHRPLYSTGQLAEVVASTVARRGRSRRKVHPATQVFQAIRIAVNEELDELEAGLAAAMNILAVDGRLAVISFHSLEDRIVKRFVRDRSRACICPPEQPICNCDTRPELVPVNKKVIRPFDDEIRANPRSRSARLRVARKVQ